MRMSKFIGKTLKDSPRDAELKSHQLMLRGGFMRQYAAGIYGLLPLGFRSISKIEKICREEMNRVDGLEVRMPCLSTKELWDETGRYNVFQNDHIMLTLNDRNEKPLLLNPTHEEPVVALMRTELSSYRQLPFMAYQIQTKFRDEPRPRGGLVRLREFTMKDGYSFHSSEECLKSYYRRVHTAYMRFYKRTGCRNFVSVESDNGLFGGSYSHEFQMLVPAGEDTLMKCNHCDYRANEEISTAAFVHTRTESQELKKIHTPGCKTITELTNYLTISATQTAKAVFFETAKKQAVVAFVRGDLQAVDKKVRTLIGQEVYPIQPETIAKFNLCPGSTGPFVELIKNKVTVVLCQTVTSANNLCTGANEDEYHFVSYDAERDFLNQLSENERKYVFIGDIAAARDGDKCPKCDDGKLLAVRGIEIGNIFHLGVKYSKSMDCSYLDIQGKKQFPTMGCYGIGITRLLPAIIEESHDDRGPILPLPIAPFEVHLCAINLKEEIVKNEAEKLYQNLQAQNLDVLFDDRDEKPGFQFADADLMGVPWRLIISPKTLQDGSVELKYRDARQESRLIKLADVIKVVKNEIDKEYRYYNEECLAGLE